MVDVSTTVLYCTIYISTTVTILILGKDFRTKKMIRDNEKHYKMLEVSYPRRKK